MSRSDRTLGPPTAAAAPAQAQRKVIATTVSRADVKKSSGLLRTRACAPIKSFRAAVVNMAIPPEIRARIAAVLLELAKATGKARTSTAIAILAAEHIHVDKAAVRAMALAIGVDLERGPGHGQSGGAREGGGRPQGSADRKPRSRAGHAPGLRAARSDRGHRRVEVTPEQAAAALDELKSLRKAAAKLGISHETVKTLVLAHRSKIITDDK